MGDSKDLKTAVNAAYVRFFENSEAHTIFLSTSLYNNYFLCVKNYTIHSFETCLKCIAFRTPKIFLFTFSAGYDIEERNWSFITKVIWQFSF